MSESTALSIYDRIVNPMEAVEKLGNFIAKSGMAGCEKTEQGMVLAMACLTERRSPLDIIREYHLIDGRLSMKSEAMLAKFNQHGGRHLWKRVDNEAAVLVLTHGEFKDFEVSYTMQDAERAGLVGKGGAARSGQKQPGGWQKNPDAMLRARCTSKAIRMVDPSVVVGVYTPEEIIDERATVTVEAVARPLLARPEPAKPEQPATEAPIDTASNTTAMEAEIPVERPTLLTNIDDIRADAEAWMLEKKWLKPGQTLDNLTDEQVANINARPDAFRSAVRTWKEQK